MSSMTWLESEQIAEQKKSFIINLLILIAKRNKIQYLKFKFLFKTNLKKIKICFTDYLQFKK